MVSVFRPNRFFVLAFAIATFLSAFSCCGQDFPELVTDRPDQTESSVTIPRGTIQLETGWTHSEDDEDGEEWTSDGFPETLLRVGAFEGLELRVITQGRIWEELHAVGVPKESDAGWGDMAVGFKKYLWQEQGCLPEASLIAHLSIPVGEGGFSSDRMDPDFRFSFAHTLTDRLSFGYNLGASWETEEDVRGERDTLSFLNYTATFGYSLSDRLGTFIEVFGDVPLSAEGGPAHSLDGGLTFLVTDNFQIDCSTGVGLSEDAEDWFIGAGVSYRFPK